MITVQYMQLMKEKHDKIFVKQKLKMLISSNISKNYFQAHMQHTERPLVGGKDWRYLNITMTKKLPFCSSKRNTNNGRHVRQISNEDLRMTI